MWKRNSARVEEALLKFCGQSCHMEEIVQFLHRVALKLNWGTVCILGQININ